MDNYSDETPSALRLLFNGGRGQRPSIMVERRGNWSDTVRAVTDLLLTGRMIEDSDVDPDIERAGEAYENDSEVQRSKDCAE